MASFFEKLTGASNEEAKEKTQVKSASSKKSIKKEKLNLPKVEKQSMKRSKPKKTKKELEEKSSFVETAEDKNWLEEAEGEEGQLTIDVYQTDSDIVIKSTIAGVKPEDIDITIANDMVTVKGRRVKDEKVETENYYYQELYWGAFSRSVILPVEVDADRAKASIKNGILTIKLPKAEKVKTKKIQVRASE